MPAPTAKCGPVWQVGGIVDLTVHWVPDKMSNTNFGRKPETTMSSETALPLRIKGRDTRQCTVDTAEHLMALTVRGAMSLEYVRRTTSTSKSQFLNYFAGKD